jgi:hypothetical protein
MNTGARDKGYIIGQNQRTLTGKYVSAAPLKTLALNLKLISLLNASAINGIASAEGGRSARNDWGGPCAMGIFQTDPCTKQVRPWNVRKQSE